MQHVKAGKLYLIYELLELIRLYLFTLESFTFILPKKVEKDKDEEKGKNFVELNLLK